MPERLAPGNAVHGNRVPAADVRRMFDRIAPIYDAMNAVMTLGLDAGWRRAAVRAARLGPGMSALDVACGSGALTRALAATVGPQGRVTGIDVSAGMLRQARSRGAPPTAAIPVYLRADARALPLAEASVDAAVIAFGLRNVPDYEAVLAEMVRVTRPAGRVVVLEIAVATRGLGRVLAESWFRRVIPFLGRLAGAGKAYAYLPASVRHYPTPVEIAGLMANAGLLDVRWRRLALGMVTLHAATRP